MTINPKRIRVLVVEDDPTFSKLLSIMISTFKHVIGSVLSAATMTDAEPMKKEADIALLDLHLPDSEGVETFDRFVRQNPNIPIIVVTGANECVAALKSTKGDAQDFLIKGTLTTDELELRVIGAIDKFERLSDPRTWISHMTAGRGEGEGGNVERDPTISDPPD